jgi:hypothetical protein
MPAARKVSCFDFYKVILKEGFFGLLYTTLLHPDSTVSEDAGIEPRIVETLE